MSARSPCRMAPCVLPLEGRARLFGAGARCAALHRRARHHEGSRQGAPRGARGERRFFAENIPRASSTWTSDRRHLREQRFLSDARLHRDTTRSASSRADVYPVPRDARAQPHIDRADPRGTAPTSATAAAQRHGSAGCACAHRRGATPPAAWWASTWCRRHTPAEGAKAVIEEQGAAARQVIDSIPTPVLRRRQEATATRTTRSSLHRRRSDEIIGRAVRDAAATSAGGLLSPILDRVRAGESLPWSASSSSPTAASAG